MDKSRLALMKIDELEELLHKNSKQSSSLSTNADGYFDNESLQKVNFTDYTASTTFFISTDGVRFEYGQNTFFVNGQLISSVATAYTIKVYINGYYNSMVELTSLNTVHDCRFLITTCNYSKETFVMLEIIPTVTSDNTITATNFVLSTKSAVLLTPTFKIPDDLGRNDNKLNFSVMDGVDIDGIYQQKYAFALIEDSKLYVGECNKENFSLENCNYFREITTYVDKGVDYTTTYYVRETSSLPHCYYYHVLYYSDSNIPINSVYKNITQDGKSYTVYDNYTNWHVTPALNPDKTSYSKTLSIESTKINFGYTTTTGLVDPTTFFRKTTEFQNFESGAIPLTRNLTQTTYLIPCFLAKEKQLYFFIEDTVTVPTLVGNITDSIDKITHAVFDGSEDKILLYYRTNGILKCYHISKLSDGYYQGEYFESIAYGMTEFLPLLDDAAVFIQGEKLFYTNEASKLWLNT